MVDVEMSEETEGMTLEELAASFTPGATKDRVKKKKLMAGQHAALLVGFDRWEKANPANEMEKHDIALRITLKKMKDPEDGGTIFGPAVNFYLKVPINNPLVPGHTGPSGDDHSRKFVDLMHAMFPEEVPAWPYYDKELKRTIFNGEELQDDDEKEDAADTALQAAIRAFAPMWGRKGEFLSDQVSKHVFFIHLGYPKKSDYAFWRMLLPPDEVPEDWEIETDAVEQLVAIQIEEVDEDEEKEAPKRRGRRKTGQKKN